MCSGGMTGLPWVEGLNIVLTMCQHNVRSAQTGFAQPVGKLAQSQPQALGGAGLVALMLVQGLLQHLHRVRVRAFVRPHAQRR